MISEKEDEYEGGEDVLVSDGGDRVREVDEVV